MTTRVDHHTEAATELLAEAHEWLADGDFLQASEKGWAAVERVAKAAAEARGWPYASRGDLYRAIDHLADETSDERLQRLFRSANALHQNVYEGWFTAEFVADSLKDVDKIIRRLSAALGCSPPGIRPDQEPISLARRSSSGTTASAPLAGRR